MTEKQLLAEAAEAAKRIIAESLQEFYGRKPGDQAYAGVVTAAILSRLASAERPMLVVFMENAK